MSKKKTYNGKPIDQVSLLEPTLEQRLPSICLPLEMD